MNFKEICHDFKYFIAVPLLFSVLVIGDIIIYGKSEPMPFHIQLVNLVGLFTVMWLSTILGYLSGERDTEQRLKQDKENV